MSVKKRKQKGKTLENLIAEMFQNVFKLDKQQVHRAQSSGVFEVDIGDIRFNIPADKLNYLPIVEAKFQQIFDLNQLVNYYIKYRKYPGYLAKWMSQLEKEVEKSKVYNLPVLPILVVKRNFMEPLAILKTSDFQNEFFLEKSKVEKIELIIQLPDIVIVPFAELLPALKFLKS